MSNNATTTPSTQMSLPARAFVLGENPENDVFGETPPTSHDIGLHGSLCTGSCRKMTIAGIDPVLEAPLSAYMYYQKTTAAVTEYANVLQALERAGDTLAKLFFGWREACFDRPITAAVPMNSHVYVYEDWATAEVEKLYEHGRIYCHTGRLFQGKSPEFKRAVLSNLNCDTVLAFCTGVAKTFLGNDSPVCHIEEIEFIPKNTTTHIHLIQDGTNIDLSGTHSVLKVIAKGTIGTFAIDITGAQFGQNTIVTPWNDYVDRFVQGGQEGQETGIFGERRAFWEKLVDDEWHDDAAFLHRSASEKAKWGLWTLRMGDAFAGVVADAMCTNNYSCQSFLELPHAEWVIAQNDLVCAVMRDLDTALDGVDGQWSAEIENAHHNADGPATPVLEELEQLSVCSDGLVNGV